MASSHFFQSSKDVWTYISTFKDQLQVAPATAYVLQLYLDCNKNASRTANNLNSWLDLKCNMESLNCFRISISRAFKKLNLLLKSLKKPQGNKEIQTYLDSTFPLPMCNESSMTACSKRVPSDDINSEPQIPVPECDEPHIPIPQTGEAQIPIAESEKTRNSCMNCAMLKATFSQDILSMKDKLREVKRSCRNLCVLYNVKKVNQQRKRYTQQIAELRKKVHSLKRENRLLSLRCESQRRLSGHVIGVRKENKNLKKKLCRVNNKANNSTKQMKKMSEEVKNLEAEAVMKEDDEFTEDDDKSRIVCDAVRKCIYFCLISHVPVEAAGKVITYVAESQGKVKLYVPHPSTISRCGYELNILCDLQCGEFLCNAGNLTLAWDATTYKGNHINQIVVSSKDRFMTLTTDLLPGGTSEDYADHLVNSLKSIVRIFASFREMDYLSLLSSIVCKFQCTMTDRASVNHCTAARLMTMLNINLLELNCQLHPLETFASATRDALLEHEKSASKSKSSQTFGQMAGAVNVVAAISKLRFKDGKGDPLGFKIFLKSKKIDRSLIPRYIGNRLHVIFHLGGSIYFLKDHLLTYLKTQCNQQKLRLALIGDLSNIFIVNHLQVLGLFGKIFTGPWMRHMYSSSNERNHMEKTGTVLTCLKFLQEVRDKPELLLTTEKDSFGESLPYDEVLIALKDWDRSSCILEAIAAVASKVHSRLERQFAKYVEDPLYCPWDRDIQEKTASASVHNMACERGLGMIDCLMRRGPNSSVKTVDAKVRGHLNCTLEWLESSASGHCILAFARKAGAVYRKQYAKERAAVEEKILKRQQQKGQMREMVQRKKKEKEIRKAIDEDDVEKMLEDTGTECGIFVRELLNGVTGQMFQHLWATTSGEDDLYNAKVKKIGKKRNLRIAYWKVAEDSYEADAVDYEISLHSIITDAILGDIIL